jgi:hypothetical protein
VTTGKADFCHPCRVGTWPWIVKHRLTNLCTQPQPAEPSTSISQQQHRTKIKPYPVSLTSNLGGGVAAVILQTSLYSLLFPPREAANNISTMSFLGGAECSTAGNPLSQFTKHVQDDKSLQRDRLVGRGPGGMQESMRTQQMGPGQDGVSRRHRKNEKHNANMRMLTMVLFFSPRLDDG